MHRVLVTGAAGFIGGHLVEALKKEGYKIRAIDLHKDNWGILKDKKVEFVKSDLCKKINKRLLKDIDVIFHCAALFDFSAPKKESYVANVEMVRNLCNAVLKSDVKRFIHWGSAACYGNTDYIKKADERAPFIPGNFYEESKAIGESTIYDFHNKHDIGLTVLRPTGVYGPRSFYGTFISFEFLTKFPISVIPGKGNALESNIHVEDVVGAALFLLNKKKSIGQSYNVSDDKPTKILDTMNYLSKLLNVRPPKFRVGEGEVKLFLRFMEFLAKLKHERPEFCKNLANYIFHNHVIDNTKLKKEGYKLKYPDFKRGIKPVLDWYLKQKILKKGNYRK
jgi:nucleoside-diphosphate-sugar epimerase